jgi:hypothetical protein
MGKGKSFFIVFLTWATVAGNILFILWITYNGIQEHFRGTVFEKISYIGIMGLLAINSFLILRRAHSK